ncbi:MAG TPA: hypothetical protein EYQ83_17405 [Acidobacteria bacterium]|nr:hypothetical protein [Acidobacteriota bacterium]
MGFAAHDSKVRAVATLADARAWLARSIENAKRTIDAKSDEEWGQPLPAGPVMGGVPRAAIFGAITDHTAHQGMRQEHTATANAAEMRDPGLPGDG